MDLKEYEMHIKELQDSLELGIASDDSTAMLAFMSLREHLIPLLEALKKDVFAE